MKISIITPSYNQGDYIEQTIRSVIEEQDYDNIEYIIIDGGSTDETVDIIKKYEDKIAYWVSEKDDGQTNAINKGVERATGDIITWLCSDDYYEPNILGQIVSKFKNNSSLNLVCGNRRTFGYGIQDTLYPGLIIKDTLEESICFGQFDQPPSFFRKECWDSIFPLSESLHVFMDLEMWLRFLVVYGVDNLFHLNKVIANGRFHANSKSVTETVQCRKVKNAIYFDLLKSIGIDQAILKKISNIPLSEFSGSWNIKQTISTDKLSLYIKKLFEPQFGDRSFIYRDVAAYFMYLGNNDAAIKNMKMAIREKPFCFENYRGYFYALRQKIFS